MILLIDNYDSFVYNLGRYFTELGRDVVYCRNDKITVEEVREMAPEALVISPGPCAPDDAGLSLDLVREFANEIPILGVCLGHQVIGQVFGAAVTRAKRPMHGKVSPVSHNADGLFTDLPEGVSVTRYHSLIVEMEEGADLPLICDAVSEEGEIMALHHRDYPIYGVQFHPEAVLTQHGHDMLSNFLKLSDDWLKHHPKKVA